jgi:hypothetical protein
MRQSNIYICLLFLTGILQCTTDIAGGGSDLPDKNVVVGKIVSTDHIPAANTQVMMIPSDYNCLSDTSLHDILIDTTDTEGNFHFNLNSDGDFNIQAVHIVKRTRLLVTDIKVSSDSTIVPTDTLQIPGTVKLFFPECIAQSGGRAYFPGTTIASGSSIESYIILDSVPAGELTQVTFSLQNSFTFTIQKTNIVVLPGDTTIVIKPQWRFSKTITLNTSISGANVMGTVLDFPVLIRLNSDNFDFSQADSNGADIRFSKADNTEIPCEIERWDAVNQKAEIWAKIDTVYGNDSTQSITMFWGNPNAPGVSNGTKVFDTANGYQGVWHLSGPESAISRDATVNGYNGTPSTPAPLAVSGIIGGAQQFNGTSNYIEMHGTENSKLNFPENSAYTVSAWVLVDSIDNLFHAIVDKSNLQYGLEVYGPDNKWDFYQLNSARSWDGSRTPATAKKWVYLVGVRSGKEQYLYVNGSYAVGIFETTTSPKARDEGSRVMIGMLSNDPETRFFKGKIDEVCLSNTARSADWIKLCYMNQNTDNRLITNDK